MCDTSGTGTPGLFWQVFPSPPLPAVPVWVGDIGWCPARVVLIEPSVCQGLLDVWSLGRVWLQQRAQEVYGSCEEMEGKPPKISSVICSGTGTGHELTQVCTLNKSTLKINNSLTASSHVLEKMEALIRD